MNLAIEDYFPSKLAKGDKFCNRVNERALLKRNIELARHVVLVSPRRYGKTSLVNKVSTEMAIPFQSIDLFLAHDDATVIKRIMTGIGHAVSQLVPNAHKAGAIIQNYFRGFKISFNAIGFGLELSRVDSLIDPVEQLLDALTSLAQLAEDRKKKILFFLDEFQDIATAESSKAIQGAIRHVAQDTSWIVFVFSGSSRHLLQNLFDDSNKPLYMLCDRMLLDRISSLDYIPHIQKAAQNRWIKPLDENVLRRIFTLTELHPFYVNLLCHELWKRDHVPQLDDVLTAWDACYEIEERRLVVELERLTKNQQAILKALANYPVYAPSGQHFLNLTQLSVASTRLGLKALAEKDLIQIIKKEDVALPGIKKGQYKVLDPLLSFALRKYS